MLDIGLLADFEDWRKRQKKNELIDLYRELYTEMPDDVGDKIEAQLAKVKPVMAMDDNDFTLNDICYLAYLVRRKEDPYITFEQVTQSITRENMKDEMEKLFGKAAPAKKKIKRPRPPANRNA